MAFYDTTWYVNFGDGSTTGHYAVTVRPQNTAVVAGVLRRQFTAPAVGSERVFVCIVAGTTANVTDATWVLTRGAKTTDGTATWQECTGASAVNGDLTNTPNWTTAKATGTPTLGAIIKRNSGASYQICTTAGTMAAAEPSFSDTAGVTTNDGTSVWTCIGPVGNFTGGQAPHARISNAVNSGTWAIAGNTTFVGDNHAETNNATTQINPPGSLATVTKIVCHNHSGSYPPATGDVMAGASITLTGANFLCFNGGGIGTFYFYGITFVNGSTNFTFAPGAGAFVFVDRCSFQFNHATNATLSLGGSVTTVFNNTTMKFGGTGQAIIAAGSFIWQNTATPVLVSGSTVPTVYLINLSGTGSAVLEALDLSQLTAPIFNTGMVVSSVLVKDCKLNAALTAQTFTGLGNTAQFVRCDSGATGYKSVRYSYDGAETTETSITRVGGASDPAGQAQSRKIVTTANAQWLRPFKAEPYAIWNATTGANVTVTVYGLALAAAVPNNDDVWLEVEYLGSSASPLGTMITTTKANVLAANAAVSSDASTWNNGTTIGPASQVFDGPSSSSFTLSNSNRTALRTASSTTPVAARTTVTRSTGKYYHEFTYIASHGSSDAIGIVLSTGTASDMNNGNNSGVVFLNFGPGQIYSNNSNTGSLSTSFTAGDVIGIATDLDNHRIWFRKSAGNWNNSGTANPATNTGGFTLASGLFGPAVSLGNTGSVAGDGFTMNCGQVSYANAAPSGFGNWLDDGTFFTPFKLTTTLSSPQPAMAGYIHARVRAAKASTTYYFDPKITLT